MGLSYQGTFGPHFFEDDEGKAETVKTANYIAMLRGKFIPILKRKKILGICHFQQDGAPLIATMRACPGSGSNWGRESSPGRLTLAGLHTAQTSIQLIFFLWGYLTDLVYSDPIPRTTDQLKENIKREVRKLKLEMVKAAMDNMLPRVQNLLSRKGAWFEKLLKY